MEILQIDEAVEKIRSGGQSLDEVRKELDELRNRNEKLEKRLQQLEKPPSASTK